MPEDELGNGYEFLIKKFADDSGHTAQEFYTNRTLVHLMVQMLAPKPGERIYDPTCGTGGMLISALAEVKRKGGEHRTLRLYGQERNHMTAAIARMNLVLHGVEDAQIARADNVRDWKSSRAARTNVGRGRYEDSSKNSSGDRRPLDQSGWIFWISASSASGPAT